MGSIVIGICGGTGSGKTTLASRISKAFGSDAAMLSMDSYYKSNRDIPFEERVKINYDHPDSFDTDLLVEHLKKLKNGETIYHPVYDFTRYVRTDEVAETKSAKVIILEGLLNFYNSDLLKLQDIKIFVDTDADVRILRRILRDVRERGRSLESVVNQYLATVKPMYEHFIEPTKRFADIIVPEGGYNEVAYEMIVNTILHRIANNT